MIWLLMATLGVVLTLLGHELSHLLAVKRLGGQVTAFKPWPHRDMLGRFWFGRVYWHGLTAKQARVSSLAPIVKSIVMALTWHILASHYWAPLWALACWELVDAAWWARGYVGRVQGTDGGKYRHDD